MEVGTLIDPLILRSMKYKELPKLPDALNVRKSSTLSPVPAAAASFAAAAATTTRTDAKIDITVTPSTTTSIPNQHHRTRDVFHGTFDLINAFKQNFVQSGSPSPGKLHTEVFPPTPELHVSVDFDNDSQSIAEENYEIYAVEELDSDALIDELIDSPGLIDESDDSDTEPLHPKVTSLRSLKQKPSAESLPESTLPLMTKKVHDDLFDGPITEPEFSSDDYDDVGSDSSDSDQDQINKISKHSQKPLKINQSSFKQSARGLPTILETSSVLPDVEGEILANRSGNTTLLKAIAEEDEEEEDEEDFETRSVNLVKELVIFKLPSKNTQNDATARHQLDTIPDTIAVPLSEDLEHTLPATTPEADDTSTISAELQSQIDAEAELELKKIQLELQQINDELEKLKEQGVDVTDSPLTDMTDEDINDDSSIDEVIEPIQLEAIIFEPTDLVPEALKSELLDQDTLEPEIVQHKTLEPETLEQRTLEPKKLETEPLQHKTLEPEVLEQKTLEPKKLESKTLQHRTLDLDTLEPEALEPETLESKSLEPETLEPESLEPETLEPETLEPETLEPETLEPETWEPKTLEPKKLEPEIWEPKTLEPKKLEPETWKPKTLEPKKSVPLELPVELEHIELNSVASKLDPTNSPESVTLNPSASLDPIVPSVYVTETITPSQTIESETCASQKPLVSESAASRQLASPESLEYETAELKPESDQIHLSEIVNKDSAQPQESEEVAKSVPPQENIAGQNDSITAVPYEFETEASPNADVTEQLEKITPEEEVILISQDPVAGLGKAIEFKSSSTNNNRYSVENSGAARSESQPELTSQSEFAASSEELSPLTIVDDAIVEPLDLSSQMTGSPAQFLPGHPEAHKRLTPVLENHNKAIAPVYGVYPSKYKVKILAELFSGEAPVKAKKPINLPNKVSFVSKVQNLLKGQLEVQSDLSPVMRSHEKFSNPDEHQDVNTIFLKHDEPVATNDSFESAESETDSTFKTNASPQGYLEPTAASNIIQRTLFDPLKLGHSSAGMTAPIMRRIAGARTNIHSKPELIELFNSVKDSNKIPTVSEPRQTEKINISEVEDRLQSANSDIANIDIERTSKLISSEKVAIETNTVKEDEVIATEVVLIESDRVADKISERDPSISPGLATISLSSTEKDVTLASETFNIEQSKLLDSPIPDVSAQDQSSIGQDYMNPEVLTVKLESDKSTNHDLDSIIEVENNESVDVAVSKTKDHVEIESDVSATYNIITTQPQDIADESVQRNYISISLEESVDDSSLPENDLTEENEVDENVIAAKDIDVSTSEDKVSYTNILEESQSHEHQRDPSSPNSFEVISVTSVDNSESVILINEALDVQPHNSETLGHYLKDKDDTDNSLVSTRDVSMSTHSTFDENASIEFDAIELVDERRSPPRSKRVSANEASKLAATESKTRSPAAEVIQDSFLGSPISSFNQRNMSSRDDISEIARGKVFPIVLAESSFADVSHSNIDRESINDASVIEILDDSAADDAMRRSMELNYERFISFDNSSILEQIPESEPVKLHTLEPPFKATSADSSSNHYTDESYNPRDESYSSLNRSMLANAREESISSLNRSMPFSTEADSPGDTQYFNPVQEELKLDPSTKELRLDSRRSTCNTLNSYDSVSERTTTQNVKPSSYQDNSNNWLIKDVQGLFSIDNIDAPLKISHGLNNAIEFEERISFLHLSEVIYLSNDVPNPVKLLKIYSDKNYSIKRRFPKRKLLIDFKLNSFIAIQTFLDIIKFLSQLKPTGFFRSKLIQIEVKLYTANEINSRFAFNKLKALGGLFDSIKVLGLLQLAPDDMQDKYNYPALERFEQKTDNMIRFPSQLEKLVVSSGLDLDEGMFFPGSLRIASFYRCNRVNLAKFNLTKKLEKVHIHSQASEKFELLKNGRIEFPSSFLEAKELKLSANILVSVNFEKFLKLSSLTLSDLDFKTTRQLRLPPMLKDLALENCHITSHLVAFPSTLRRLVIRNGKWREQKLLTFNKLKELRLENVDVPDLVKKVNFAKSLSTLVVSGCNVKSLMPFILANTIRHLDFSSNEIDSLEGIKLPEGLTLLNLSGNGISRLCETPPTLTEIDFSNNQLQDLVEIGQKVEIARLNNNPELFRVKLSPRVKILDLSGTSVGELSPLLSSLTNIEELFVNHCLIRDGHIEFPPLLKVLAMNNCFLDSIHLSFAGESLKSLDLSNNRLTHIYNIDLSNCTNLQRIDLSNNQIHSVENIELTESVTEISFSGNLLKSFDVKSHGLVKLDTSMNKFASVHDCVVPESLKVLKLSGNAFRNIPPDFVLPVGLNELYLDHCNISEFDLKLPAKLVVLSMTNNKLHSKSFHMSTSAHSRLKCLDLSGNFFKDFPMKLLEGIKLVHLKLINNMFDIVPSSIPSNMLSAVFNDSSDSMIENL